ncbi:hypothetical protein FACS1894186_0890 [Alphaproteobacteria bacterium]|nr:hypothetical protein FACS1894186_0890 [Alphaproteobacteria bacterium]
MAAVGKLARACRGKALMALVALALVAAAWLAASRPEAFSRLVFPALAARLPEVEAVTVDAGAASFAVQRDEGGVWRMPAMAGYPADGRKVEAAIVAIAAMRLVSVKTADQDLFAQHLVADDDYAVSLLDGTGAPLARLILGARTAASAAPGSDLGEYAAYARAGGGLEVLNVRTTLQAPQGANDWLDRRLLAVAPSRVESVAVGGRQVKGAMLALAASVLGNLRFTSAVPDIGAAALLTADIRTSDGLAAELQFVAPNRARLSCPPEKRSRGKTTLEAAEAATYINARHNGWLYGVPEELYGLLGSLSAD